MFCQKKPREYFNFKPAKKASIEIKNNSTVLKPKTDPESFVKDFLSIRGKKLKKINITDIKKTLDGECEVY